MPAPHFLKDELVLHVNYKVSQLQTSRFPYIGSWCVLSTVLTQFVMAAVCFQKLSSNFAFIPMFITLGRLIVWVILCGSHCVGHIVWVTFCV